MDSESPEEGLIIDSVKTFIDILEADKLQQEFHSHIKIWYRGQSNIDWPLKPKLYRENIVRARDADDRRLLNSHLSREFKSMSGVQLTGQETDRELYFLQQHYGLPTALLDWTNNPLIALWFAVNDLTEDHGSLTMMDVYKMENLPLNWGIRLPSDPYFVTMIKNIYTFSHDETLKSIFPIRPDHKNQRITHQQSFFTFHVPEDQILTADNNPTLRTLKIPAEFKRGIKKTLRLIGINSYFIFGNLEHLSSELQYAYLDRWHEKK